MDGSEVAERDKALLGNPETPWGVYSALFPVREKLRIAEKILNYLIYFFIFLYSRLNVNNL